MIPRPRPARDAWRMCVLLTIGVGCAAPARDPFGAPAPAADNATASSTTRPAGPIRLADARRLERLLPADAQITMTDVLRPVDAPAVYFGQIDQLDDLGEEVRATATILATRDRQQRWLAVPIDHPRLPNGAWMYVGAGPSRGEAWAILDADPEFEGAAEIVLLLHTLDSCATWTPVAIDKPSPRAVFDSFCIGPQHGRLTVYQIAGAGAARAGYYHYTTTDGGRTWSRSPNFEPDAMIPADPVPESDQPDLKRGAVQRADAQR